MLLRQNFLTFLSFSIFSTALGKCSFSSGIEGEGSIEREAGEK